MWECSNCRPRAEPRNTCGEVKSVCAEASRARPFFSINSSKLIFMIEVLAEYDHGQEEKWLEEGTNWDMSPEILGKASLHATRRAIVVFLPSSVACCPATFFGHQDQHEGYCMFCSQFQDRSTNHTWKNTCTMTSTCFTLLVSGERTTDGDCDSKRIKRSKRIDSVISISNWIAAQQELHEQWKWRCANGSTAQTPSEHPEHFIE